MNTRDVRSQIIEEIKKTLPAEARGSRDRNTLAGTLLSALVMSRELGFSKDEIIGAVKEEWLHLVELDNKTVKGAK